jgi:predicted nucleic acid-binding protein
VIVVDFSVWVDFFNGSTTPQLERLDALLGVTPVAIGDLILVAVLQGFRHDRDVATVRQLFRSLPVIEMLDPSNAAMAAENFQPLLQQGVKVRKTVDAIIATACIEANLPLLVSDRDSTPFVTHLGLEAA